MVHATEVVGPQSEDIVESSEISVVNIQGNLNSVRGQLMPGHGWATGYHFRLYKEDGVLVLTIRGIDNQGNPAVAAIDAKNDILILRQHKMPSGEWKTE